MTRGILIAGNESSLSAAIAAETAKRVEHFVSALIPSRLSELAGSRSGRGTVLPNGGVSNGEGSPAIPLQWNPGSPIAARTVILAAENRLEHIDEAILVCTPPSMRRRAAELLPADIEILINDHIKGWFFLVRELTQVFRAKQSGTLALVLSDMGSISGKDDRVDLLGPPAAAAFRAFAQSLLSSAFDEPYLTMGFSSSEIGEEGGFAAFVLRIIDEGHKRNNGKWHKYGKLNFFR
jgi:NAD(P)-dependent dehydrogenase (short-subunit alcohol dehydrogenase family)